MIKRTLFLFVFILSCLMYFFAHEKSLELQSEKRGKVVAELILPAKVTAIASLGNKGVYADYLFLKLLNFLGHHILWQQALSEEDWRYVEQSIDVITELDPYFHDPYFFTQGFLPWEGRRVESANRVLEKAIVHVPEDWRFPYFVAFNHFYFLKDYEKGAEYMMMAAKLPNSPSYLAPLASRLAYYGGKTETGIHFLREFLSVVNNPVVRNSLQRRLSALEGAAVIEVAIKKFQKEQGRLPREMMELVSMGYLENLPVEPYGGQWGVLQNGRVFSTSRFVQEQPGPSR